MEVSDTCSWKSDICPHRVYNFTTTTEKSKVEGRQSRFLGLILGMDPLCVLRASGMNGIKRRKKTAKRLSDIFTY